MSATFLPLRAGVAGQTSRCILLSAVKGGDPKRPLILVENVYRILAVPRPEEIRLLLPAVVYAQDPVIPKLMVEYPGLDHVFINDHAGAVSTEMTGRREHDPWSDLGCVYEVGILLLSPRVTTWTFADVGNVALAVGMFDMPFVDGNMAQSRELVVKLFLLVGIERVHVHMDLALAIPFDERGHGVILAWKMISSTFVGGSSEKVL